MTKDGSRHAKEFAIEDSELTELINKTEGKDKLIAILAGRYAMREGEIVHMRSKWLHIGDNRSQLKGIDHIQVPSSDETCSCDKCMLQEYFILCRKRYKKKYGHKPNHEWYRKMEKRFYRLKNNGKLPKLKPHAWSPKSGSGAGLIPLSFPEYTNLVKEFFENNETICLSRQAVWQRVRRMGRKYINKPNIYPHSLRSTALMYFADRGMTSISLTGFGRWKDIASSKPYINPKEAVVISDTKRIVEMDSSHSDIIQ